MKKTIILLTLLVPLFLYGQEKPCRTKNIEIEKHRKYLAVAYKNNRLVYSGLYGTPHWLPLGAHYAYDEKGRIKRVTEYSFGDEYFEGVPIIIEKIHCFNDKEELEKIIQGKWCNECEFEPIGIWEYYKKGKLVKTIDTQENPYSDSLLSEYMDDEYTKYYEKLEQDCQ